jgi:GT2 family glycosyltransferase
MPIAVAGMHRSGTSMVAHALKLGAVYFGEECDLFEPSEENPDGYWEHLRFVALNDEILARLGGGWERPPDIPPRFDDERLRDLRTDAKRLIRDFRGRDPWAWKDPRNSLTIGLWAQIVPDLAVVICVRNPLEVAISLRRRAMFSYTNSLELWESYNRRVLQATAEGRRLVTDYESYFSRPRAELRRLLAFAGVPATRGILDRACAALNEHLRHSSFTVHDLLEANVAPQIVELYVMLRREAGLREPAGRRLVPSVGEGTGRSGRAIVDERALDAVALRQRVKALESIVEVRELELRYLKDGRAAAELQAKLTEKRLKDELRARERQLARALLSSTAESGRARHLDADDWKVLLHEHGRLLAEVEELRTAVQEKLLRDVEELQASVYDLQAAVGTPPSGDSEYQQLVRRVRQVVRHNVPRDATVLVVSRGDDALLDLGVGDAWHFPRTEGGLYAGYYPKRGLSVIAHLETLRARGADHLLFPATALWWLDHYPDVRQYLEGRYRRLVESDDVCTIFALRPPEVVPSWQGVLSDLLDEHRICLGRDPAVLDWDTGLELANAFPEDVVFSPVANGSSLPYADASVDVVAVAGDDAASLAEANRVAASAVVVLSADGENGAGPDVQWKLERVELPTLSIVIPCYDGLLHTEACLATLCETLPSNLRSQIVVVDDAATDGTAHRLAALAELDGRIKVVRNQRNLGFLESANRGAEVATGDILLFLNNDTVLLHGWLQPLLRVFMEHSDAGAVGGRLLYPDGTLQEAGGLVFADGSAAKFGYGDPDPEAPLYNYQREVDYCSACLLATKRSLFTALGGFDRRYAPGFYEDTDYCFTLREQGLRVYYEPKSTIVHVEGGTAGTDLRRGPKRFQVVNSNKFARKWKAALKCQPERPPVLHPEVLYELVPARGART